MTIDLTSAAIGIGGFITALIFIALVLVIFLGGRELNEVYKRAFRYRKHNRILKDQLRIMAIKNKAYKTQLKDHNIEYGKVTVFPRGVDGRKLLPSFD